MTVLAMVKRMVTGRINGRKLDVRAEISWFTRKKVNALTPIVLTVGSICTGIDVAKMALRFLYGTLSHHIRYSFACDRSSASKYFCAKNHPEIEAWYDDICSVEFWDNAPAVNLVTAGFPCQPFRSQGRNKGVQDPRGQIIEHILAYLQREPPDCFLLENVTGLLHRPHFFSTLFLQSRIHEQIKTNNQAPRDVGQYFAGACGHERHRRQPPLPLRDMDRTKLQTLWSCPESQPSLHTWFQEEGFQDEVAKETTNATTIGFL